METKHFIVDRIDGDERTKLKYEMLQYEII